MRDIWNWNFKRIILMVFFCGTFLTKAQDWTMTNVAGNGDDIGGTLVGTENNSLINSLYSVSQMAMDSEGSIYFIGNGGSDNKVVIYKLQGNNLTIIFEKTYEFFLVLKGLAIDSNDNIYFSYGPFASSPSWQRYIYRIPAGETVPVEFAGDGSSGITPAVDGIEAATHAIGYAGGLVIREKDGNEWLYYSANNGGASCYIQKIYIDDATTSDDDESRLTYRVAGTGLGGVTIDYPISTDALMTDISAGFGIAFDNAGNAYYGTFDNRVVKISSATNELSLFAGSGGGGTFVENMNAKEAPLVLNTSGFQIIEKDGKEFMILADPGNNVVRKIEIDGAGGINRITTFCGSGAAENETSPYEDLENGFYKPALECNIKPYDILITGEDEFLISDDANRIRQLFVCDNSVINSISNISTTEFCKGDSITLEIDGDIGFAKTWNWYKGDECLLTSEPNDTGERITVYVDENTLTYSVSAKGSCSSSNDCMVETFNTSCKEFFNTFTPNGDGKNDFFEINTVLNYPLNTVSIYNRWGELLKEIENYDNETKVWTGANEGDVAVGSGTYFFTFESGGETIISGWIELIK